MSPEAQRIAIAESRGYYNINSVCWRAWKVEAVNGKPAAIERSVPDYLNDLNAMRDAVEHLRGLPGPEWYDFRHHLEEICGSIPNCINATAAQRVEAFLKTLGLWVDGEPHCTGCGGAIISKLCSCGTPHPEYKQKTKQ